MPQVEALRSVSGARDGRSRKRLSAAGQHQQLESKAPIWQM